MLKQYIELIGEEFKNRKVRTLLTTLGIIIGISLIFILITLGQGMENAIEEQFSKIGIKSIRIVPGHLHGPPTSAVGFDKSLKEKIEDIRGVDYIDEVLIHDSTIGYDKEKVVTSIMGYNTKLSDKAFIDTDTKLESGRFFRVNEKDAILLGNILAKESFSKEIRTKNQVIVENKIFHVIGIFEKTGTDIDGRAYIPLEVLREISNEPNLVNVFVVKIKDGFDIEKVAEDIRKRLRRVFKSDDEFQVFTPEQLIKQIQSILGALSIVLVAIAAISIFVGAIGIMNSMYTNVLERTKEIGVMKAVGARNSHILSLFLLESSIIGLIGGIIGVSIGIIISLLIDSIIISLGYTFIIIKVDPELVIGCLLFAIIIGTISGLLPSYRASKLQIVDALRYE
ncbi:ABC transporter permease [Candidatus Woesearchaeota archaeon]|nr:ABC transporter permease [Candidatus Woesearchaeota archaeon]